MQFYFVATDPNAAALLKSERVDHMLVSIAHWRKRFDKLLPGVNYVIDSGAYTNVLATTKNRVSIEDYEEVRNNQLKDAPGKVDYIIMFDDATSRAKTIKNWYRHKEKGHTEKTVFVDHLPFFGLQRDEIEKIYHEADRVAISLPDTAVEAAQRVGAKARTMVKEDLHKKLATTLELAKQHKTKTHLLAVMRPSILTKFKFDALDSAVWINGSKYGNSFIYRRTPEGDIKGHWAQYHNPRFKEFLASRFRALGLDPKDARDRDRFNVRSMKAYERYLNGDHSALMIIRKFFEYEEPTGLSIHDFMMDIEKQEEEGPDEYELREEIAKRYATVEDFKASAQKVFPGLKMPDPQYNLDRMKGNEITGLFSRKERAGRVGEVQALVNEILKPGDPQQVYALVTYGPGTRYDGIGAVPKNVIEGIDQFTHREFQPEKVIWFHPFTLVKEFKPPLELKETVPGRRYASDIDLEHDVQKTERQESTNEVPDELRTFTINGDRPLSVNVQKQQLVETKAGTEFLLVLPGSTRPWLLFPLDTPNENKAQSMAVEAMSGRQADYAFIAQRIGAMENGLPCYMTKFRVKNTGQAKIDLESIFSMTPEELNNLGTSELDRAYQMLHVFFEQHFADSPNATAGGASREDVVNTYLFVLHALKNRGRPMKPVDALDSEAKDLDPEVFVEKQGTIEELVDDPEWQKLRESMLGSWKDDPEKNVGKLREYLGDFKNEDKLKRVRNYLAGSGFRSGEIDHPAIDSLREEVRDALEKRDLAPISASGDRRGRKIELQEVLDKIKSFRFRQDAVMLVGGLVNHGSTENDIDILIKGPLDEATRHVLKFRLGRMLGPELSQRVQFLDDELGGPFTNNVPLGHLTFEIIPQFELKEMRDVAKQDDPLQDMPKTRGKRDATFQLHFRGKGVHGDLRMKVGDYLTGWTLALQKPGSIDEPVTTTEEAKKVARGYDVESGNSYLKPMLAPTGVYSTPKSRQPAVWMDIEDEEFEPGSVGSTRNYPAVFVAIDKPKVEWGRQSDRFHEYFLSDGKILNGILLFRALVSEDEAEGGTPAGEVYWKTFVSKTFLPSVLRPRTVSEGVMPPPGFSWLPMSLEQDVPKEYRYWDMKGEKAREARDALVATKMFTEETIGLVNGEIRLLKEKRLVCVDGSEDTEVFAKALRTVDYTLSRQTFRGPLQVRSGFTKAFWWLVLDQPGSRGVKAWKLQTDPLSGEDEITAVIPNHAQVDGKDLLNLSGSIEPGTTFNTTKDTPSNVAIVGKGTVDLLDEQTGFLKLRFKGGPLRGIRILEAEGDTAGLWRFSRPSEPGEPLDKGEEEKIENEMIPKRDGIQVWDPDKKNPDLDRKMLQPLAIYKPMKPVEGFFKPEELIDKWAKPEVLKAGLAVEPKFNGYRAAVEIKGGKPLVFFEDSKSDRSKILPSVVNEMAEIEKKIGPFVLDAEFLDYDEDGVPLPRRELSKFTGDREQDDSNVKFNIFGALFLNGKNTTAVSYENLRPELQKAFDKIGDSKHFVLAPNKIVHTEEDLAAAMDWATNQPGSEGAMVKMLESTYTLGGETDSWAKMKATRHLNAIVWQRDLKKPGPAQRSPAQTYVYEAAVGPIPEKDVDLYEDARKIGGKWYTLIGRTFATNVKANPGDTIEVEFTEILVDDTNEKKRRVHWFTPVVVGTTNARPSTFDEATGVAFEHERRKFVDKILEKHLPIIKADEGEEEKLVYGIVLEPETIDAQNDVYSEEEIKNAAHRFMEEFRHLGVMHKVRLDGRLKILETYLAPQELTIGGTRVKKGTWLLGVRVLDSNLWKAVKEGKLTGFSIGGSAVRKPTTA